MAVAHNTSARHCRAKYCGSLYYTAATICVHAYMKQLMQPAMVVIELVLFTAAYIVGIGLAALFETLSRNKAVQGWHSVAKHTDFGSRY